MDCYNKHINVSKYETKYMTCTLKGAHSHPDLEMSDPDPVSPPLFENSIVALLELHSNFLGAA